MKLPSHTKVWSNVSYLVATGCFAKIAWEGKATEALWLIYLAIVGMHVSVDQVISILRARFGGAPGAQS